MRERLLTSIKDLATHDDEDHPIAVTQIALRQACNRTTWATGKGWDEILHCAQELVDAGDITIEADPDTNR